MTKLEKELKELLPHLNKEKQMIQAMEECGELIQAIAKELNDKPRKQQDLIDEIADVLIMTTQISLYFNKDKAVERRIDYKLGKIKKYVDSSKNQK